MTRARILVADDHSFVLRGIIPLLEDQYEIAGLAENGKVLVDAAIRLKPDLIVLDVSMPILNGIDAAREIRRELPSVKIVVLTMHTNAIYLRKALEAGASGYVLKSGAAEELLTAIERVLKNEVYITPQFGMAALELAPPDRARPSRAPLDLTSRQRQVLQLIAEGKQNKEIANILHVSVKTVEFHRSRLTAKLGVYSVAELTILAIQEGLIGTAHTDTEVKAI